MYAPPPIREERRDVLSDAIQRIQLAGIVTANEEGYAVTHAPMVLHSGPDGLELHAHVARSNEHWTIAGEGAPSVALFQGPQAYVSPSWFPSKAEHGRVVPTWAYIAVHAHGRLEAVDDPVWLRAHLDDLTRANEARRPQPWAVDDAPESFVAGMVNGVVGLRLRVDRLEGAWKLLQRKPDPDRMGAIGGLSIESDAGRAVAEHMRALQEPGA